MDLPIGDPVEGEIVLSGEALPALRPNLTARDQLAQAWLDAKANDSEHTAAAYERDIRTFFAFIDDRGADVFALIPAVLDQYRKHLQTPGVVGTRYKAKTKRANSTVARMLTAVSSFYKYGQTNRPDLVRWNPVEHVTRPKPPRVSSTLGLSPEELAQVLDVARRWGNREYALLMLLAGTGVRVSEAINADTSDLLREGDRWYLRVIRKGGEEGLVGVAEPVARALRRYMRGRRGALFLNADGTDRMTRRQAAHLVAKATREAAKVNPELKDRRISPHSLRHTIATTLLDEGESISNVQALLGHTTIATTARYDRARRERRNPAVDRMARILDDGMPDEAQ